MFQVTYIYTVFQYQACVNRTQAQYDRSHVLLTEMLQTEVARAILSVECIYARVETKQGMKQLEYHKVMDSRFLFLLVSDVALLVHLKGGHDAGFKLTIILGGRGPKFVQVKTPSSDITSLLIHKIFVDPLLNLLYECTYGKHTIG